MTYWTEPLPIIINKYIYDSYFSVLLVSFKEDFHMISLRKLKNRSTLKQNRNRNLSLTHGTTSNWSSHLNFLMMWKIMQFNSLYVYANINWIWTKRGKLNHKPLQNSKIYFGLASLMFTVLSISIQFLAALTSSSRSMCAGACLYFWKVRLTVNVHVHCCLQCAWREWIAVTFSATITSQSWCEKGSNVSLRLALSSRIIKINLI